MLRDFFVNHPRLWNELCNALRSGTTIDEEGNPYFDESAHAHHIYSLLLVRNRPADIGNKLVRSIRSDIFLNTHLLKHARSRQSLLDSGSHIFDILKNDPKPLIEAFIVRGFVENIEGCTYENIDTFLPEIIRKIANYLPTVFGQNALQYYEF